MTRTGRYPSEVRERAVRLVTEHRDQYTSEWAAITSIATKCGMTSDERERLRELERENRELRRANEILKDRIGFFRAELDPRLPR
jgi:transposase